MAINELEHFYELFRVSTSEYWKTHYTFQKSSKASAKQLSKPFIDLLLINTILPVKFYYNKLLGEEIDSSIVKTASQIKTEKNNITDAFNSLRKVSKSSLESQALIQLKTEYCDKNNCLKCAIGNQLLSE